MIWSCCRYDTTLARLHEEIRQLLHTTYGKPVPTNDDAKLQHELDEALSDMCRELPDPIAAEIKLAGLHQGPDDLNAGPAFAMNNPLRWSEGLINLEKVIPATQVTCAKDPPKGLSPLVGFDARPVTGSSHPVLAVHEDVMTPAVGGKQPCEAGKLLLKEMDCCASDFSAMKDEIAKLEECIVGCGPHHPCGP